MFRRRASAGLLLTGLLFSVLPGGTFAQSSPPTSGLEDTDWTLVQIAGSGVPFIDVPASVNATLRIDGTQAGGNGGCNSWFGDVKIDGDAIVFGQIGSTMMACQEPNMAFEGLYLHDLAEVQAWAIADGRLQLSDANGAVLLVFAESGTAASIEGTDWRASTIFVDGSLMVVPAGIDVTLLLADGQAAGSAGCNRYFGGYALDGDALVFAPQAATEMACPEPRMQIESAWLTALGLVTGWRIDGDQLHLLDAGGHDLAVLAAEAATSIVATWSLAEIGDGNKVALVDSTASLTFGEDGSLTGDTGCNSLTADYAIDGPNIKIGPVGTTRMACKDDDSASMEAALLAALEGATSWTINIEGWLELADANGALLAALTPATVDID